MAMTIECPRERIRSSSQRRVKVAIMTFCTILITSLLLVCEGREQSRVHPWLIHHPIFDSNGYGTQNVDAIRPSQISLEINLQNDGIYNKISQITSKDLEQLQMPPQPVLDAYANHKSQNVDAIRPSQINLEINLQNYGTYNKISQTTTKDPEQLQMPPQPVSDAYANHKSQNIDAIQPSQIGLENNLQNNGTYNKVNQTTTKDLEQLQMPPQPVLDAYSNHKSQNVDAIRPSQISLEINLQNYGTYNKISQITTKDLEQLQMSPQPVLDANPNHKSKNVDAIRPSQIGLESNLQNKSQDYSTVNQNNNEYQNFSNSLIKNNTGETSNASKNSTAWKFTYISNGLQASFKNFDLPQIKNQGMPPLLLQWHVGVYSKAFEPYMQICGGTLVTTKAVISAAHCFWSDLDGKLPASRFVVAAGKIYRPWNDSNDIHAQKSEVSAIHLPPRFRGSITSFQDDIAVVLLASVLTPGPAVRPLCVLFNEYLEYIQLQRSGRQGVILGWGLTGENGPPARALQYLYMPYVPIEECIANSDPTFLKYITSDKICAGVTTGKALCRGDSGGGLVFFYPHANKWVPFLYGVASTAPRNEHLCNTHARATLTRVLAHRGFLRTYVPDMETSCSRNYAAFEKYTKTDLLNDTTAVTDIIQE